MIESEISIPIQSDEGKADYQRSVQQAAQIRALAEAEADKTRLLGTGEASRIKALAEAEAEKAARIGVAQPLAIDEQVRAYGGRSSGSPGRCSTGSPRRSRPASSTSSRSMGGRDVRLDKARDAIRDRLVSTLGSVPDGGNGTPPRAT